jgi:hypothetical protein
LLGQPVAQLPQPELHADDHVPHPRHLSSVPARAYKRIPSSVRNIGWAEGTT